MFKKVAIFLMGAGTLTGSTLLSYQITRPPRKLADHEIPQTVDQTRDVFDKNAEKYDSSTDMDEWIIGIRAMRQKLLKEAQGSVLEVAAGTGRNVSFYRKSQVEDIFAVDSSEKMLSFLHKKSREYNRDIKTAVMESEALEFPDNRFDTVVDTFGLCSVDDPEKALGEMVRVCKPGGKILLLEHGRSQSWSFVTNHLDKRAKEHAASWGCWWNRDIKELVRRSNIDVIEEHTKHFGTTYFIVGTPRQVADGKTTNS